MLTVLLPRIAQPVAFRLSFFVAVVLLIPLAHASVLSAREQKMAVLTAVLAFLCGTLFQGITV